MTMIIERWRRTKLTIDTKQALGIDDGGTDRKQGKDFDNVVKFHDIIIIGSLN